MLLMIATLLCLDDFIIVTIIINDPSSLVSDVGDARITFCRCRTRATVGPNCPTHSAKYLTFFFRTLEANTYCQKLLAIAE